jgi:hypothetical protein
VRMRTLTRASLVASGFIAAMVFGGTTAFAATPSVDAGDVSASSLCDAESLYGNTPIYAGTSVSTTKIGSIPLGTRRASGCSAIGGGSYSACGYDYNGWVHLTTGSGGYVKSVCVKILINA